MGRRKIEIKAIKDDRNRSVTFLKRKGGLFKKAHELSILCSVDVAVIIFGHNKKLYEFSSGNINETIGRYQYYGQPHEHKGPADFKGKNGGDDEEDDDEDMSPPREDSMPPQQHPQMMPPHLQHPPTFNRLRQSGPSASPPTQNGMFPVPHGSPQPQMLSRPSSRDAVRRSSSNLVPMQTGRSTTPQPGQGGYAYMPNQGIFDPRTHPNLNPPPTAPPQFPHFPHHPSPQPMHQSQMQHAHQAHLQEQRRQSMPPAVQTQERPHPTPPMPHQSLPPESPPQPPPQQTLRPPEHQSPPQNRHNKSQSIFTPIDPSGSVLANIFFPRSSEPPRQEIRDDDDDPPDRKPRIRHQAPVARASTQPIRTNTMSSDGIVAPSRASTTTSTKSSGARPRLALQIPSEASDSESKTAEESSAGGTIYANANNGTAGATGSTPGGGLISTPNNRARSDSHHSSGVVLPPPSPSASALLSAGATGPPNPFARPPPPQSSNQANNAAYSDNRNNNIDTPISALPSRFVADNLLPSPSSFYPDWGFGGRSSGGAGGHDSGMLPSPLTFPTPVVGFGAPQGWGRSSSAAGNGNLASVAEGGQGEKRKSSAEEMERGDGGEQVDAKKIKV